MKRYGSVIRVKPDKLAEYRDLHAHPWPDVVAKIAECNITNYTIFLKDDLLFSYFEYIGSDFDSDMEKMAADPTTQEWWKLTDPCQTPFEDRAEGEWWSEMEPIFRAE